MKQYDYSVNGILRDYFGKDVLGRMRAPQDSIIKDGDKLTEQMMLALSWQYADEQAMDLFLESRFLAETIVEDDYIAYIGQCHDTKYVYLMFMLSEDEVPFSIELSYATELAKLWREKGYEPKFVSVCIKADFYPNNNDFRFTSHMRKGYATQIYELRKVNGKDILAFEYHRCWDYYYNRVIAASRSSCASDYVRLFEDDVKLTFGEGEEEEELSIGCERLMDFFSENGPVTMSYAEFRSSGIYTPELVCGKYSIDLSVNRKNLICEVNLQDKEADEKRIVECRKTECESPTFAIPRLCEVTVLDPKEMHGFALQLSYADQTVRNYYLGSFEGKETEDSISVDGQNMSREILHTVRKCDNGICVANGYKITVERLYYHSYRQIRAEQLSDILYEDEKLQIKAAYRIPLTETKNFFSAEQHWGYPYECYGPTKALFDADGNRVTNVSFYSINENDWSDAPAMRVCVEPTGKYGYIKKDGTWFVPPIYDEAEDFCNGCAEVKRMVEGEKKRFFINSKRAEIPFDSIGDSLYMTADRCRINTMEWSGTRPRTDHYDDFDDVKAGKWGFIDSDGKVIVEPQYVYAIGFSDDGGKHSIVAKYVDGVLRWGIIDRDGKETVPCQYAELYTRDGAAVAFQEEKHGPCGLMDYNGNIIVAPKFGYIDGYNGEHQLISAGEDGYSLGVYSVADDKMIIPCNYDYIDYGDRIISCEPSWSAKDEYFDYTGQKLDYGEYDSVIEFKGMLEVRKDDQFGLIDYDGTVVIPPMLESLSDEQIALCKKGYIVTGSRKLKGFSAVNGRVIIPQKYSEISIYGDFLLASTKTDTNWHICDELYLWDGKPILTGLYRRMRIRDGSFSVETPRGKIFCKIILKK